MSSNQTYHEKELLHRIAGGEEAAFRSLYDEYYSRLLYFAESLIRDRVKAEDIVIVAFTKFWERRDGFESLAAVRSFLYITIRNACYKLHNQELNRQRLALDASGSQPDSEDFIESRLILAELIEQVHQSIQQLDPKYGEVIRLLFIEEQSVMEVAEQLGISAENVRKRKERALAFLRSRFLRQHLGNLGLLLWVCEGRIS